ncbi:MAG TPA: FAD-binding protein [Thermoplasmata archaeon]|nr:FAD-binding protein [Thermoplasmata archaeon]
MELAVLLKGVPLSEELRYDPVRRAVARESVELVANPFDQRALRVGLALRRVPERLTVVALGPPSVRPLLREAVALGADRALHLCAPAFAGSDVLATASVLAAALRGLRADLVLAGSRSTDSDTGLVGPEVAALLDVPLVTGARAVRRGDGPEPLEIVHETARGHATVRLVPPAVVAVGEKIGKPLHVSEEAMRAVDDGSIRTLAPVDLGLGDGEVGEFASPTRVASVADVDSHREGRRCAGGSVADRVRAAVEALAPLLVRHPGPPPLPWPPAFEASREIAVLVSDDTGRIDPSTVGTLSTLRHALPDHTVTAVVYGPAPDLGGSAALERAGALGGFHLDTEGARFDVRDVSDGLDRLLDERPKLAALVAPSTPFGREAAGLLAGRRRLGAVGDALEVRVAPDGPLEWTKPSFGGRTVAAVRSRSSPTVVTMPPGASVPSGEGRPGDGWAWHRIRVPSPIGRLARESAVDEPVAGRSPDGAEVVVAVGAGIGGPERIAALGPLLERWDAALVGTRRVVDAGWLPVRAQLGLTGRLLAPRLAVLLGVRGAVNHMVGWRRAGTVVAVNRDPEAPVFADADVGIVGELEAVVPALVEPVALALRAAGPP